MSNLIIGIDPGLATGGMVLIKVGDSGFDDEVIDALSLVDRKKLIEKDKQKSRQLIDAGSRPWGDRQFTEVSLRTNRWVAAAVEQIILWEKEHGKISCLAIESFVDQPSRAKQMMKLRWQTPFLIGAFEAGLNDIGYNVSNGKIIYQNAGTVLKQWEKEIEILKNSKRKANKSKDLGVIVKGDAKITNDHLRKALVHGLALAIRIRENKKVKTEVPTYNKKDSKGKHGKN